jgi:hypothetical protein
MQTFCEAAEATMLLSYVDKRYANVACTGRPMHGWMMDLAQQLGMLWRSVIKHACFLLL